MEFLEERTGIVYHPIENDRGKMAFSDTISQLDFIWLLPPKAIKAISVPLRTIGFPFATSDAVKKIDLKSLRLGLDQTMKEKYGELINRIAKTQTQFEQATSLLKYFDRNGEAIPEVFKGKEGEPDPAFYDEYKEIHTKLKARLKKLNQEFLTARNRVARELKNQAG